MGVGLFLLELLMVLLLVLLHDVLRDHVTQELCLYPSITIFGGGQVSLELPDVLSE